MSFTIKIDTDNDAFQADMAGELRQILGDVINHLHILSDPSINSGHKFLVDSNGNTVGRAAIGEPDWQIESRDERIIELEGRVEQLQFEIIDAGNVPNDNRHYRS